MTRAERRTHWRTIIENQATSGMSVATYCRENLLNRSHYYKVIHIRKSTRPEPFHRKIYDALHLSHRPGKTMKTII